MKAAPFNIKLKPWTVAKAKRSYPLSKEHRDFAKKQLLGPNLHGQSSASPSRETTVEEEKRHLKVSLNQGQELEFGNGDNPWKEEIKLILFQKHVAISIGSSGTERKFTTRKQRTSWLTCIRSSIEGRSLRSSR